MRYILFTIFLITLSCEKNNKPDFKVEILSSFNNFTFDIEEDIELFFNIKNRTRDELTIEFYIDDNKVADLNKAPWEHIIESKTLSVGEHTLRVFAQNSGNVSENEMILLITDLKEESDNVIIFENLKDNASYNAGWNLSSNEGYGDKNCLESDDINAVFKVKKTFTEEGSIRFYIKNNHWGNYFMIDGKQVSKWFPTNDWTQYNFYVTKGTHTFCWKADTVGTKIDSVLFRPGKIQHSLGENYGGGIIYFVDENYEHGLIASKANMKNKSGDEFPWGCMGLEITEGNRAGNTEDGAPNTEAILASCDERPIAASVCADYTIMENNIVYDDWYLPAERELHLLYYARDIVRNMDKRAAYWASNTIHDERARIIIFIDGSVHGTLRRGPMGYYDAVSSFRTRAVRKF